MVADAPTTEIAKRDANVAAAGLHKVTDAWWNRPRSLAAQLLAEDELPDHEIAARCKKSRNWLAELKRLPQVQERIRDTRQAMADAIMQHGIAVKANRIAGLDRLAGEVRAVIDDRGMIERTITTTESAEIVRERFARELSAEMRAIYRAVAEEMGQLPKADTNVQQSIILIRQVIGVDNAIPIG